MGPWATRPRWKARASAARQVFWTRGLRWAAGPGLPCDLPMAVAPTGWAGVPRTHVTPIRGNTALAGRALSSIPEESTAASGRGARPGGTPGGAQPQSAGCRWPVLGAESLPLPLGSSAQRPRVTCVPSVVLAGGGGSLTSKVEATGQRSSAVDPGISEHDRRRRDKGSERAELEWRGPGRQAPHLL